MPRVGRLFKKRNTVGKKKIRNGSPKSETFETSLAGKLGNFSEEYEEFKAQESTNEIIDISLLVSSMSNVAVCKECGEDITITVMKRIGLAMQLQISCVSCSNKTLCYNSKTHQEGKFFEINTRYVYALRCIGKGKASGKIFCGVMNFSTPPSKFIKYVHILGPAVETVCKNTMKEAVQEAVEHNDSCRDIAVALDGSWQKRGHVSQNGVMTATSVDTGKVIDCQVFSKYCRCSNRLTNIHKSSCQANYVGTSGGMEVAGAKLIFNRSLAEYNVRYVQYLGDGDCKAFQEVVASKPYGDEVIISKLECIGHVQKRMGTRLRKLKIKSGKRKLCDGKSMGGKNRLTDSVILSIQKYYGLAIRRNVGNIEEMKKAVWAEYFHLLSDNNNPQHGLCPDGIESWCKYRVAEASGMAYDHTNHFHISPIIMDEIKHIFRDLANPDLLKKCTHGKTQNPNESLNNVIWSRIPKTVFISLKSLTFGVQEAVASFNKGNIVKCHVLKTAGIEPGANCVEIMEKLDILRISDAKRKMAENEKKSPPKKK